MKKRIALLFGGEGCEREISKRSAAAIYPFIKRDDLEVIPIYLDSEGKAFSLPADVRITNDVFPLDGQALTRIAFTYRGFIREGEYLKLDLVFPLLHGDYGEDGALQGLLTSLHIPYIGEDVYTSALCQDKSYTKAVARLLSVPTADWIVLTESDSEIALARVKDRLSFPLFIKPARLGSSIGAGAVYSDEQFIRKYRDARRLSERILIEKKIDVACEFECALLTVNEKSSYAVGIIETDGRFYDFTEKYESASHTRASVLNEGNKITEKIIEYSKRLQNYIGIKEISRFDFLLDKSGNIFFGEINTIPGMTKTSLYPRLCESMGHGEGEFISLLISSHIG